MFCTGGIRCEKAGPFLEREGFEHVYQLDGGILKYFEEVGSAHYDGECFVFDQRVGVDPALRETPSVQCFHCQMPLTAAEQGHPHYQPPRHCPHCYRPPAALQAEILRQRHAALHAATHPLPGLAPYENRRPIRIAAAHAGLTLHAALLAIFPHVAPAHWDATFAAARWRDASDRPVAADHRVTPGEYFWQLQPATTEPPVATDIRILHEDEALVVLHKPAPLPMHPSGRFHRHTLEYFLNAAYAPHRPRPAHRLDANTTGLVVCARTGHLAGKLQPQFTRGEVDKLYLARVHGQPATASFTCDAPITDAPETAGARRTAAPGTGQAAHTTFQIIAYRASDDTTLLEAQPATGRTNQIRLHLQHLGHSIVGDPLYGHTSPTDPTTAATLHLDAQPLHLHCARLTFTHPTTQQRVTFEAPQPPWA
jgi:RluA family pseudouridine synthase